jgi:hypothetical protein
MTTSTPRRPSLLYGRTIIAYHGCDVSTAARLLAGEPFKASRNDYDWLGSGTYFWEYGPDRALRFAELQKERGKVKVPAMVGAIVQLGRCLDLMDTLHTSELPAARAQLVRAARSAGVPMPKNEGRMPDRKLRRLDCAVLNLYLLKLEERGVVYDTVRGSFSEGPPAFRGSGIRRESHVQLAVRNPACILGVFRP